MKRIIIVLAAIASTASVLADDTSMVADGMALEIASAIPRDVAFVVIVKDNSVLMENLIENGVTTRDDLLWAFENICGVETSDDGSVFDIFTGEIAIAVYDRQDFGGKGKSFDPGLLIIAEMPDDRSSYEGFEDDLIEYIKGQAEETETGTWYSKTEIKIKDKKYRNSQYKRIEKKTKTESRYTDTDGKTHEYKDESESEYYLGYNETLLILSTEENMYKKTVDTSRSDGGLSNSLPYLSCLSRVNPNSDLITYTPAESFDILSDVVEREYRDKKDFPFGDLLGDIDGMMTSASLGGTGPTDEAVMLLPDSGDNPFIRALGQRKTLQAPGNVPGGYTAYFFYACESINQTIVEVIPALAATLESSDASEREISEITETIAYFQELSPGLLSSAGDEIAVIHRQKKIKFDRTEYLPKGKELPERLEGTIDGYVDEYIVAFDIADKDGFERGIGFLDENTPESKITVQEKPGTTYYQFLDDEGVDAVFALRGDWGYGAQEQDSLDYFIEQLESGTLRDDSRFIDGMSHLQSEHNALVYLDYSAKFKDKIDNNRLAALIRPTIVSIVYDGEAVEIEGYPYNFWTYIFSSSYALGSMAPFSAVDLEEYPDTMGEMEEPK